MARFDVYANPEPSERSNLPYFLDVQNEFLSIIETRVMVPLFISARFDCRIRMLNPELEVLGKTVVMDTASIAAVPVGDLRRPVANLLDKQFEIQDALDTLLGSY